MHVGAAEIADGRVGIGERARAPVAALLLREFPEQRDGIEDLALVLADAATHVGVGQYAEQVQVHAPRQLPDTEFGCDAAPGRFERMEGPLVRLDERADRFTRGERNTGIPQRDAGVDGPFLRMAGVRDFSRLRMDRRRARLGHVVQQRGQEDVSCSSRARAP